MKQPRYSITLEGFTIDSLLALKDSAKTATVCVEKAIAREVERAWKEFSIWDHDRFKNSAFGRRMAAKNGRK